MDDPKRIGQVLDEVTDKIPKLISNIINTVYSSEAGTGMGQAVGNLYKELVASGIPQEDAVKMAKDYMLSIKDFTGNMVNKEGPITITSNTDDDNGPVVKAFKFER